MYKTILFLSLIMSLPKFAHTNPRITSEYICDDLCDTVDDFDDFVLITKSSTEITATDVENNCVLVSVIPLAPDAPFVHIDNILDNPIAPPIFETTHEQIENNHQLLFLHPRLGRTMYKPTLSNKIYQSMQKTRH